MAFAKLIAFDRPLIGVTAPGVGGRVYTEAEVAKRVEEAYRRGVDDARASADQQMVEFRADIEQLNDGLLKKLSGVESLLVAQLREALPELAVDIARRLLAGYEPPPELVSRLCEEALAELFPERENLELVVGPRDADFLTTLNPEWMMRYPGLRVRIDPTLGPGDCQVHSRFGLTDARQQTKLKVLAQSLSNR
ncbi:MAG: FliH/SctL family protein [Opitutus sp.]|nr:FliH/SctL family protein [Opitutus sp.]